CRCGTINCEAEIVRENGHVSRRSTTFSSRGQRGQLQRSAFSGSSLAPCLPRSWTRSRYHLPPSVRLGDPCRTLKGHRVAGAVIKAPITSTYLPVLGAWFERIDYGDYTLFKAPMRGSSLFCLLCPHSIWAEGMLPRLPASYAKTRHAFLSLHHRYGT